MQLHTLVYLTNQQLDAHQRKSVQHIAAVQAQMVANQSEAQKD
jgi:hypothetical protein